MVALFGREIPLTQRHYKTAVVSIDRTDRQYLSVAVGTAEQTIVLSLSLKIEPNGSCALLYSRPSYILLHSCYFIDVCMSLVARRMGIDF